MSKRKRNSASKSKAAKSEVGFAVSLESDALKEVSQIALKQLCFRLQWDSVWKMKAVESEALSGDTALRWTLPQTQIQLTKESLIQWRDHSKLTVSLLRKKTVESKGKKKKQRIETETETVESQTVEIGALVCESEVRVELNFLDVRVNTVHLSVKRSGDLIDCSWIESLKPLCFRLRYAFTDCKFDKLHFTIPGFTRHKVEIDSNCKSGDTMYLVFLGESMKDPFVSDSNEFLADICEETVEFEFGTDNGETAKARAKFEDILDMCVAMNQTQAIQKQSSQTVGNLEIEYHFIGQNACDRTVLSELRQRRDELLPFTRVVCISECVNHWHHEFRDTFLNGLQPLCDFHFEMPNSEGNCETAVVCLEFEIESESFMEFKKRVLEYFTPQPDLGLIKTGKNMETERKIKEWRFLIGGVRFKQKAHESFAYYQLEKGTMAKVMSKQKHRDSGKQHTAQKISALLQCSELRVAKSSGLFPTDCELQTLCRTHAESPLIHQNEDEPLANETEESTQSEEKNDAIPQRRKSLIGAIFAGDMQTGDMQTDVVTENNNNRNFVRENIESVVKSGRKTQKTEELMESKSEKINAEKKGKCIRVFSTQYLDSCLVSDSPERSNTSKPTGKADFSLFTNPTKYFGYENDSSF